MQPIKVFITEDESIVREGLRDMIPWEQYGFTFVGDASDGEMALPMVRRLKPDILITDIRMPFMDGLEFSRLVSRELPKTKIIILSGYDDFEYARQAIELHVDQYLLKPITRTAMIKALELTKQHIAEEQEQQEYLSLYIREQQEYEHVARRLFFEKLVSGEMTVPEIYEQAARLEIALDAECYNTVLFTLEASENSTAYSERISRLQDQLISDLLQRPDLLIFRSSVLCWAVLIKGTEKQMEALTRSCLGIIESRCRQSNVPLRWYAALGTVTKRLSGLPRSYADAGHALAWRHLTPQQHVLRADTVAAAGETDSIGAVDSGSADPMLIRSFIEKGLESEIDDFVSEYFSSIGDAVNSLMFRHYLLLSARINALATLVSLGIPRELAVSRLPSPAEAAAPAAAQQGTSASGRRPAFSAQAGTVDTPNGLRQYLTEVLHISIALRTEENQRQSSRIVESAIRYIDQHYNDDSISLNAVARAINVSTNYLSAVFSQKMGLSFVEYLTQKRMEKAKYLLRNTAKRSGEIAYEVGYKDPRYFSFVFKKTQQCTPRDYRAGNKTQNETNQTN